MMESQRSDIERHELIKDGKRMGINKMIKKKWKKKW